MSGTDPTPCFWPGGSCISRDWGGWDWQQQSELLEPFSTAQEGEFVLFTPCSLKETHMGTQCDAIAFCFCSINVNQLLCRLDGLTKKRRPQNSWSSVDHISYYCNFKEQNPSFHPSNGFSISPHLGLWSCFSGKFHRPQRKSKFIDVEFPFWGMEKPSDNQTLAMENPPFSSMIFPLKAFRSQPTIHHHS